MTDGATTGRTCPWCGVHAAADATTCPGCGAALAERDSLGGLVIPGVTSVDPALKAIEDEPLHLVRPSASQGLAGGTIAAAVLGGPAGLAALGGLAAVAAVEYATAGSPFGEKVPLDDLGRPSEAALEMARRLDASSTGADVPAPDGAPPPGGPTTAPSPATPPSPAFAPSPASATPPAGEPGEPGEQVQDPRRDVPDR